MHLGGGGGEKSFRDWFGTGKIAERIITLFEAYLIINGGVKGGKGNSHRKGRMGL